MKHFYQLRMIDEMRMRKPSELNHDLNRLSPGSTVTDKGKKETERLNAVFEKGYAADLERATVFDVQNIFQYVNESVIKENRRVICGPEDFPNFRLPYPVIWMEYRAMVKEDVTRVGMLCRERPLTFGKYLEQRKPDFPKNAREVEIVLFYETNGIVWGPIASLVIAVTNDGTIFKSMMWSWIQKRTLTQENDVNMVSEIGYSTAPALYAIQFMNCKNISQDKKEPPTTINERHRRNHPPLVTYRILRITQKHGHGSSASESDGTLNRYHICRGHFKHFTPEKPLLGHAVGTYWWSPHARGTKEKGEIIKDYEVEQVKINPVNL